MPIVRISSKLVYFAHVPKCAGSAVEDYLAQRFGSLGFLDRAHLRIPQTQRWTRSSPQHIDVKALDLLLPPSFFAAKFALVRHPVYRMARVFSFQRDIEGKIEAGMDFGDWLDSLTYIRRRKPFHLDNHFRPMSDLIPEDATIFRLEDGTAQVVKWLDELAGNCEGAREIEKVNTYEQRLAAKNVKAGPTPRLTMANRRKIEDFFRADFDRFDYPRTVKR